MASGPAAAQASKSHPRQHQSYSSSVPIRSELAWSQALTGRAVILRVSSSPALRWRPSRSVYCISWFPTLPSSSRCATPTLQNSGPSCETWRRQAMPSGEFLMANVTNERERPAVFGKAARAAPLPAHRQQSILPKPSRQLVALAGRYALPTMSFSARRRGRRADQLWGKPDGFVSPRRRLYRAHPQRQKARRPAGLAVVEVRAGHQSQTAKALASPCRRRCSRAPTR